MTRGKHKNMAERRREVEAAETELVALRRRNAQMVEEIRTLRADLIAAKKSHQDEARILRAQRDEGQMPLVAAAEKRLRDEMAAHQRTRTKLKRTVDTWDRGVRRLFKHFETAHGLTPLEATETVLGLIGSPDGGEMDDVTLIDTGAYISTGHPKDRGTVSAPVDEVTRTRAIQRARGVRRSS